MYLSCNGWLAVEPLPNLSLEKSEKSGFQTIQQVTALTRLEVIFGDDKISAGSFVFVDGEVRKQAYSKKIYEVAGKKFILIPSNSFFVTFSLSSN